MGVYTLGDEDFQVQLGIFQRVLGMVLIAGEPLSSWQLCVLINMENQDFEVQKVLCGVIKKRKKFFSFLVSN